MTTEDPLRITLAHRLLQVGPGVDDTTMCHRQAGVLRAALKAAYEAGKRDRPRDADAWDIAKDKWLLPGVMRK